MPPNGRRTSFWQSLLSSEKKVWQLTHGCPCTESLGRYRGGKPQSLSYSLHSCNSLNTSCFSRLVSLCPDGCSASGALSSIPRGLCQVIFPHSLQVIIPHCSTLMVHGVLLVYVAPVHQAVDHSIVCLPGGLCIWFIHVCNAPSLPRGFMFTACR